MPWPYWTVVPNELLYSGDSALPVESRSVSIVSSGRLGAGVDVLSGAWSVSVAKSGLLAIGAPSGRCVIVVAGCGCA